jgi:hypothetical protein
MSFGRLIPGILILGGIIMAHRKNLVIKTKYKSISECKENCRDIPKKRTLPVPASGKIYGVVYDDGSVRLSSRKAKTSVIFEFNGSIEARDDGIYLVGEIRPKTYQKWIMIGFSFIFHLIGLVFIWTGEAGGIVSGILIVACAWTYIFYLKFGDSLYIDLIRKVG